MDNKQYHADKSAIGKSGLDLIHESPADYFNQHLSPNPPERKQTPAKLLGSALHALVLEPEKFKNLFTVAPELDRRTADGKMEWTTIVQLAEANGTEIITSEIYDKARKMRDALHAHPITKELLFSDKGAMNEYSYYWTDPVTGVKCKAKADRVTSSGLIIDVKTAASVNPEELSKDMFNYRYHVQDAWYTDGFEIAHRVKPEGFLFITVRNEEPYLVKPYMLDEPSRQLGRDSYRFDLDIYAECLKTGIWPAYPRDNGFVSEISLPKWAFNKL